MNLPNRTKEPDHDPKQNNKQDSHGPGWKLAILFVEKLPAIIGALATLFGVLKSSGWF
jgi:hypothetical protein